MVSFECRCMRGRERSGRRNPTLGRNTGKILRLEITGLTWSWVPPSHLRHSCGFSNDRNRVLKRMLTEMAVKGASSPGAESLAPRFTDTQVHMLLPTRRGRGQILHNSQYPDGTREVSSLRSTRCDPGCPGLGWRVDLGTRGCCSHPTSQLPYTFTQSPWEHTHDHHVRGPNTPENGPETLPQGHWGLECS